VCRIIHKVLLATVNLDADEQLVRQLNLSKELKKFAVSDLDLPDTKSYDSYVALERDFPVWVVVAANEFSVKPKKWCYPVIGCAAYRGYFRKQRAIDYAKKLRAKGYEISLGGAAAYSTLGWFSDPLLPSMMRHGDTDFAETLFHEIAHQKLYINGDSAFNEAFATLVGQQGVIRWLKSIGAKEKVHDYQLRLIAKDEFNALVREYKKRLGLLYSEGLNDNLVRQKKQHIFSQLKKDYDTLKAQNWAERGWFDSWFSEPLNNARLASFSTYNDQVPLLKRLLLSCQNDFSRFYNMLSKPKKNDEGRVQVPLSCVSNNGAG